MVLGQGWERGTGQGGRPCCTFEVLQDLQGWESCLFSCPERWTVRTGRPLRSVPTATFLGALAR